MPIVDKIAILIVAILGIACMATAAWGLGQPSRDLRHLEDDIDWDQVTPETDCRKLPRRKKD